METKLWRSNTETPYYLYMYIDPIGRPYTKIYIQKLLQNEIDCKKNKFDCKKSNFDCKNNELDRKTLYSKNFLYQKVF